MSFSRTLKALAIILPSMLLTTCSALIVPDINNRPILIEATGQT